MKPQAPEDIPPVSAKFPRATQKSCLHSASESKAVRLFYHVCLEWDSIFQVFDFTNRSSYEDDGIPKFFRSAYL